MGGAPYKFAKEVVGALLSVSTFYHKTAYTLSTKVRKLKAADFVVVGSVVSLDAYHSQQQPLVFTNNKLRK